MEKQFYTLYEAAEALNIGYSTLRLHIKEGRIPFAMVGKRKFITADTIKNLAKSAK